MALRFLKDAKAAQPHFQKLEAGVSRPISLARAHYWQGRAYEALGDTGRRLAAVQARVARRRRRFYGQIALARIDATPTLHLNETPVDASGEGGDFEQDDLAHAMHVLADLGQVSLLRIFALRDAGPASRRAAHGAALAQALIDMGFREVAVRVAKQASYNGMPSISLTRIR